MRIVRRARKADNGVCKRRKRNADDRRQNHGDQNARFQNAHRAFAVLLAPTPCNQRRDGRAHRHKQRQTDELRLLRQAHRCNGVRAQRAHHDGIDKADERHQKRFHHRRPRHVDGRFEKRVRRRQLARHRLAVQNMLCVKEFQKCSPIPKIVAFETL